MAERYHRDRQDPPWRVWLIYDTGSTHPGRALPLEISQPMLMTAVEALVLAERMRAMYPTARYEIHPEGERP